MAANIDGKQMYLNGFAYQRARKSNGRLYWACKRSYAKECRGRAITSDPADGEPVEVFKESSHTHPPDVEANKAAQLATSLKRKARDHPAQPPAQLLRTELQGVEEEVLSQLPSQPALVRSMQRVRRRELPPAPTKLKDIGDIPARYRQTLVGEQFLLHDSGPPEDDDDSEDSADEQDDEVQRPEPPRVLVFATRKNIELLCQSSIWFVDGTFRTAPHIFAQIFTIIGLRTRTGKPEEQVAVPLVYALLSGKTQAMYTEVLEVVRDAVAKFRVAPCTPTKIMSDFEVAIINACRDVFPQVPVSACYFHLGQIVYQRIQDAGLQVQYRDPDDPMIKRYTHMLLALAFVPQADVQASFTELRRDCPEDLLPVFDDFNEYYVSGRPRRGRRAPVAPRYPVRLWNQYDTALTKSHRTNNISEGWHNRFRVVIRKHHPDLYTLIEELQKEQGYMEICVTELALGKKVKSARAKKWTDLQTRIGAIASEYDTRPIMEYLQSIAANVTIS
jgi:hypothetical protein